MIEDILTLPEIATIDGKEYKFEYDCKAYAIMETMTGKSTFEIKDLMLDNKLGITDSIEVICAGLLRNHTDDEVKMVRTFITENLYVINSINMAVVNAFIKPLTPPEIYEKLVEAKNKITKAVKEVKKNKKSPKT